MIFTKFLKFKSSLSINDIINKSSDYIGNGEYKYENIFTKNYFKKYKGYINEKKFEIRENIVGRNSFRPVISGIFFENNNETEINITVKIEKFVLIFLRIWIIFAIFMLIFGIVITIEDIKNLIFCITPMLMVSFGILISITAFNSELDQTKTDIKSLFNAFEEETKTVSAAQIS